MGAPTSISADDQARLLRGHGLVGQALAGGRGELGQVGPGQGPGQDPGDVGVDRGDRQAEAKQATALAVYGPTPGREASSSTVAGQPPRSTTRLGRPAQGQRPPVVAEALPGPQHLGQGSGGQGTDVREPLQGQGQASAARAAWVCWASTSATSTR